MTIYSCGIKGHIVDFRINSIWLKGRPVWTILLKGYRDIKKNNLFSMPSEVHSYFLKLTSLLKLG
jgi:hypothetical protein